MAHATCSIYFSTDPHGQQCRNCPVRNFCGREPSGFLDENKLPLCPYPSCDKQTVFVSSEPHFECFSHGPINLLGPGGNYCGVHLTRAHCETHGEEAPTFEGVCAWCNPLRIQARVKKIITGPSGFYP